MLCIVPKSGLMKLTRVWKNLGFNQELAGGNCFNIFLQRDKSSRGTNTTRKMRPLSLEYFQKKIFKLI